MSNAGGWYRRAGKPVSDLSLQDEWSLLADEMLARKSLSRRQRCNAITRTYATSALSRP